MNMQFELLPLLVIVWNSQPVKCRPENLFLDSINQLGGNDVDFVLPERSGDFLDNNLNSNDLAFNSDLTLGGSMTDASSIDSNDLFPPEDSTSETVPLLQGSTSCGTDVGLTTTDEDVPLLQARNDALCGSSTSRESLDGIINLFKDPEYWLRENIPPKQRPTGQTNVPGQYDDDFSPESLQNRQPIPGLFEDDEEKCPPEVFGLSVIPVCHNGLRKPSTQYPSGWTDLYYVEPCMLLGVILQ